MAKGTRKKKDNQPELTKDTGQREYIITAAAVKDEICNYSFEVIEGVGAGSSANIKGIGCLIKPDLTKAFARTHVHLAVIDDAFKNAEIEIDDIDKFNGHDITFEYHVDGIVIKGKKGNESVIIIGSKHSTNGGGRMTLRTPKIMIDDLASYKWYNELRTAVDTIREEVALYKEGKYTPVETEDPNQLTIDVMIDKTGKAGKSDDDDDNDTF